MKPMAWTIVGIAASLLFVLGTGGFAIQRIGLKMGAVFGLNGELVGVTTPGPALLPLGAIAAVSAVALAALTLGVRRLAPRSRFLVRIGFTAATAVLVVVALVSLSFGAGLTSYSLQQGMMPGWDAWLEEGGSSSAVHVVLLVMGGCLWLDRGSRRQSSKGSLATAATTADKSV
jgi:hypothetical protein